MPTQAASKAELTEADLVGRNGSENFYLHALARNVIYSDGVRDVAEKGGAYWLVDAIASYLAGMGDPKLRRAMAKDPRIKDQHFWALDLIPSDDEENRRADLTARADSGERPFITQEIEYTDFPLKHIDIWASWDGERWILILPSEY